MPGLAKTTVGLRVGERRRGSYPVRLWREIEPTVNSFGCAEAPFSTRMVNPV
jgi:hypothetical protein